MQKDFSAVSFSFLSRPSNKHLRSTTAHHHLFPLRHRGPLQRPLDILHWRRRLVHVILEG